MNLSKKRTETEAEIPSALSSIIAHEVFTSISSPQLKSLTVKSGHLEELGYPFINLPLMPSSTRSSNLAEPEPMNTLMQAHPPESSSKRSAALLRIEEEEVSLRQQELRIKRRKLEMGLD